MVMADEILKEETLTADTASGNDVILKVENLKVYYKTHNGMFGKVGYVKAVDDVSFEIKKGEVFGIVGESGCGKSTTLRMVAGLEDISDGELYIDGKLCNDIAPKDVIDKKVREVAEILDITQYLERKPKALSGGQRQRVAIGRAMVRDPKVFLMDEPLSNLDAQLRNQMRAEIIKLRQRINTTFMYVTHDQTEALFYVWIMICAEAHHLVPSLCNGIIQMISQHAEIGTQSR